MTIGELLERDERQTNRKNSICKTVGELFDDGAREPMKFGASTTPSDCEPLDTDTVEQLRAKEQFAGQRVREIQSRLSTAQTRAASAAVAVDLGKWAAVSRRLGVAVFDAEVRQRDERVPVTKTQLRKSALTLAPQIATMRRHLAEVNDGRRSASPEVRQRLVRALGVADALERG